MASARRRRGLVTIACIPTAAYCFLPATLADFARRFPAVRVMDLSAGGVVDAVASGEVEFRPLRRDPFVLACRRDHPLARRRARPGRPHAARPAGAADGSGVSRLRTASRAPAAPSSRAPAARRWRGGSPPA
ncbi:LysR substrate-binding domain-containing protein [Roseomonas sp. E05]|uniref:LysR substrate-binding domain-containing protein n=1 Tax=Roseomonas sp. E05 TaxID=3046310 RepID=UPI0024BB5BC4|nr:LysR substrate-binding domain-containing protein [Roseomonas sp. E05]MDJ0387802.1 LysR substrate-binding domain-containing protein [Roseomonas sp. E05]